VPRWKPSNPNKGKGKLKLRPIIASVPSGNLSIMANTSIVMKGPVGPDEVVEISYIPPIALNQGETYNLGNHIKDTGGRVTATRVMQGGSPLSSSKLSYDSGTKLLLGGDGGFEGGLTLEVDW